MRKWADMTVEEKVAYQADQEARERDGNKRLDFLYAY